MNRTELVDLVAGSVDNAPKVRVKQIVDQVFEQIGRSLAAGEKVSISGFGTFNVSMRKGHTGTNPKTQEAIEVPARSTVVFRVGTALKDRLNP